MRYTKADLTTAIKEGNIALVRAISMEKSGNGNATPVALAAQEHLWSGEFCRSYYSHSDGWYSRHHSLSDECEW